MRHSYDTDAIFKAMVEASDEYPGIRGMISAPFEAFLNSLPDQPGDDALREQAGLYKDLLEHPFFKDWSISGTSIRSFMMNKLDNAMTSHDEWQECTFEEICTGDQIKTRRRGVTSVYEHPVVSTYRSGPLGRRISLERGGLHPDSDTTFYRIPAPVQHPDPAQHPVIIVRESTVLPEGSEPQKVMFISPYYRNGIWFGAPDTITEWPPAKVVAEDD